MPNDPMGRGRARAAAVALTTAAAALTAIIPASPSSASPRLPAPAFSAPALSVAVLGTTVLASGPAGPHHRTIRTHAVPWTSAKPYAHGRKLRVTWWSGVAPCSVFDHITVKQTARRVVVTVYEGAAPSSPNTVCLAIAVKKTRTVKLRTPLGSRKVVDGAPRPRSH